MNTKLKNKILLTGSSFLLLLLSYHAVEAFYKFHFLLIWKIVLYVYAVLFLCGLGYYIRLFYVDDSHGLSEDKKAKKKIITFLGIALFSGIGLDIAEFLGTYYAFYSGTKTSLLGLQADYDMFSYLLLLICCLFFLLIPRKIGYTVCMQLPFYLIDRLTIYFFRDTVFFLLKLEAMWFLLLMFVVVWSILCHRRVMLEHWQITTRKELYSCLGISVVIGFLIYYFRL